MKLRTPHLLLAVTVVAWLTGQVVFAVLATLVTGALYGWSLYRDPWEPCGRCSGSKSHKGRIWVGTYGRCRRCDGKGQFPRLGVKVFTPARARALTGGVRGRYG